jgi:xanthine dehydrogenase molybdopterin-binding subunit B
VFSLDPQIVYLYVDLLVNLVIAFVIGQVLFKARIEYRTARIDHSELDLPDAPGVRDQTKMINTCIQQDKLDKSDSSLLQSNSTRSWSGVLSQGGQSSVYLKFDEMLDRMAEKDEYSAHIVNMLAKRLVKEDDPDYFQKDDLDQSDEE